MATRSSAQLRHRRSCRGAEGRGCCFCMAHRGRLGETRAPTGGSRGHRCPSAARGGRAPLVPKALSPSEGWVPPAVLPPGAARRASAPRLVAEASLQVGPGFAACPGKLRAEEGGGEAVLSRAGFPAAPVARWGRELFFFKDSERQQRRRGILARTGLASGKQTTCFLSSAFLSS